MIYTCDRTGLPAIDDAQGNRRVLGRLVGDNRNAPFRAFREVHPTMPRSEWKEINRRSQFDKTWILNQRSHGSCVGFSAAGLLMRALALSGQSIGHLSGSYIYSFINGGQDQGAVIGDAIKVLLDGVCLESLNGWDKIYKSQISTAAKQDAPNHRATEIYKVENFDEIGTAIQLGFIVSFPIMVGNNFMRLDGEGVVGFTRGDGNHAIHADGMTLSQSQGWLPDFPNSWDVDFGEDGRGRCSEKHVDGTMSRYPDAYAIRAAEEIPDGDEPPAIQK